MGNANPLARQVKRRTFLAGSAHFLGPLALSALTATDKTPAADPGAGARISGIPTAKRVIYLFTVSYTHLTLPTNREV